LQNILLGVVNSFLVLALLFLSYGLWLLTKTAKLNNTQANAGMMSLHIVAYVLCILAVYSSYIKPDSIKAIETTGICELTT
jgi:cbb3-type cytochrome oxidase subunit 3